MLFVIFCKLVYLPDILFNKHTSHVKLLVFIEKLDFLDDFNALLIGLLAPI